MYARVLSSKNDSGGGLILSDSCVDKLRRTADPGEMLRVTIEGGGCSGFQYKLSLDKEVKDDDLVFERDGAKVICDKMSFGFIEGSTVDYEEELIRSGFRILDNPQADKKCSCGASFTPKIEL
ncbi:iron-sulfur cluster assembly 2 homolog, mitochondrial-like [Varroa jacobsoni]|uniref:iron-sulfur cluster assembly 2 homolog, mitochondrial-like n=1 Tax=Varroa jacobsoni TaxID=62625 RepID=UPI000BF91225|nr:iron-sulfur cluster assembly 2 homolog, mitochondrial-like [Varroa jacobsoni]